MKNRITAILSALILVFSIAAPCILSAADDSVVYISSEKDFEKFMKSCSVDTYSQGKLFVLKSDIDLSKIDFKAIPTFGGEFDGGGFEIKNLSISRNGSNYGLFRYIQEGAVLKNLNVSGRVSISGTKSNIGGIVGSNSGSVLNCSFSGNVKAGKCVGGIAGVNNGSGFINSCTASGTIYGEHYAGGIAGQNFGSITASENSSDVNTTYKEVKLGIEDVNFDKIRSTENLADITDIGGIAGYSAGIIQNCENSGNVGYEHLGYNIGGIAGRQSGYISKCTNSGTINGRKDIGGIVGQMEPYTILEYSQDSIKSALSELDGLSSVIDAALGNTKNSNSVIHNRLSSLGNQVDNAKDDAKLLLDKTQDLLNTTVDSVNDFSVRLSDLVSDTSAIAKDLSSQMQEIKKLTDKYSDAFDALDKATDGIKLGKLTQAFRNLSTAFDNLDSALDRLDNALGIVEDSVGSLSDVEKALKGVSSAISDISSSLDKAAAALSDIQTEIGTVISGIKNGSVSADEAVLSLLNTASDTFAALKTAFSSCKTSVDEIKSSLSQLTSKSPVSASDLARFIHEVSVSAGKMQKAFSALSTSMSNFAAFSGSIDNASEDIKDAIDDIRDITSKIKAQLDGTVDSFSELSEVLSDFSDGPSFTLPSIDSDYIAQKDKLSQSLSDISDTLSALGNEVNNTVNSLIDDLKQISNQMSRVFDALSVAYDKTTDESEHDIFEDVSDEDSLSETEGKVYACENSGNVLGDVNVGGVAGSMAIEYDFDPEDDVVKRGNNSLNFIYKTKAVIRDSKNSGKVTGKKNCIGGIVGSESLGSVISSLGCGIIESTTGKYVGGIAGYSDSTIKSSYAKCTLSGENYVGGIAGHGHNITNCFSLVHIAEGDEYCGAVAGEIDGVYIGNYFVYDNIDGVDSISYSGKAEPISYEDLLITDGLPKEFYSMKITFMTDDKVYKTKSVSYGESLEDIPSVPKKKNQHGHWDVDDFENITYDITANAEYTDYVTAISSDEKRENGLPIVIEEGLFGPFATVSLTAEAENAPPSGAARREIERWNMKTSENGADKSTVHYLAPSGTKAENLEIYVCKNDGKWRKVASTADGNYVVFDMNKDDTAFSVAEKSIILPLIATMFIIIAVLALIYFIIRKFNLTKFVRRHTAA